MLHGGNLISYVGMVWTKRGYDWGNPPPRVPALLEHDSCRDTTGRVAEVRRVVGMLWYVVGTLWHAAKSAGKPLGELRDVIGITIREANGQVMMSEGYMVLSEGLWTAILRLFISGEELIVLWRVCD